MLSLSVKRMLKQLEVSDVYCDVAELAGIDVQGLWSHEFVASGGIYPAVSCHFLFRNLLVWFGSSSGNDGLH